MVKDSDSSVINGVLVMPLAWFWLYPSHSVALFITSRAPLAELYVKLACMRRAWNMQGGKETHIGIMGIWGIFLKPKW